MHSCEAYQARCMLLPLGQQTCSQSSHEEQMNEQNDA